MAKYTIYEQSEREVETRFEVGDRVLYSGSWGSEPARPGKIVGFGSKNGKIVYDVELDDGAGHWGYEYQFTKGV